MARRGEFYAGSKLLEGLVPVVGLPLDQLNFLVCQVVSLLLAVPFRLFLPVNKVGPTVRLAVELVLGLALAFFCFGHQVWYLVGQSLVCYVLMKYASHSWSHTAVFVWCMSYLSMAHILRMFYDYGGYTLDITGPLMIQTQKLTSLAFAVADGGKSPDDLSEDQQKLCIRRIPDFLSFYSYMFYFHGVMVGPLSFYSDYLAFIKGTDISQHPPPPPQSNANGYSESTQSRNNSPRDLKYVPALLRKLGMAVVCGILMVTVAAYVCPPEGLVEDAFFERCFLQRLLYVLVCTSLARQKYYFAWILGETLNLAAGFGFNGYDSSGEPRWDLNENVDIWEVECSNSLKTNIDGWNKRTLVWLRHVVYDRVSRYRTLAVFAVSAFWHGFYPGYYYSFSIAALLTIAARLIRRNVRPWFQTSPQKRKIYDAITFAFTRYANVYICYPFLTLQFMSTFYVYASLYFWMHLGALAVVIYFMVLFPSKRPKSSRSASTTSTPSTSRKTSAQKQD